MTTGHTQLRLLAGLLAAALLAPAAAAQDLDSLNEDLRVETARLEYALEKVQKIRYPVTGDDHRVRKALLKEGRFLMKHAAQVPRDAPEQIEEVIGLMADKRAEADRFMEEVQPLWAEQTQNKTRRAGYRSAFVEVVKFHDVALDAQGVKDSLTHEEADDGLHVGLGDRLHQGRSPAAHGLNVGIPRPTDVPLGEPPAIVSPV